MKSALSLSAIVLIASALFVMAYVPGVQASPGLGLVCITTSGTASSCPLHPPSIANLAVGQTLTVGVFVQGSDPMHSFDIYVRVDDAVLHPVNVTLGNLIKSPSSTNVCINGVGVIGPCTLGTVNGLGVVEVSTVESGPANECATSPCSGMALNITYVASASTGSTSISFPSVSSCSPSSVPGTTICVLLRDNTQTPVGENVQPAIYGAPTPSLISVVVGTGGNTLYWSGQFSGAWSNWQSLSGASPSSPYLCASRPGSVELVVRGMDDGIYHKTFSAGTWSATWDKVPTGVTSDQPVCAVLGNTMYTVVRGTDNELWSNSFGLDNRIWSSWINLNGSTTSAPALVPTNSPQVPNTLDLFVRAVDDRIAHLGFFNGAWVSTWDVSSCSPLPCVPPKTIGSPAAVSTGDILYVVVRGSDSQIYSTFHNPGTCTSVPFQAPPGTPPDCFGDWRRDLVAGSSPNAPTLAIDANLINHVVVRGFDNGVYEKSAPSNGASTPWDSTWSNSRGSTLDRPATATVGSTLGVVVSGLTKELWYNSKTGTSWSGWILLGGATDMDPALVAVP